MSVGKSILKFRKILIIFISSYLKTIYLRQRADSDSTRTLSYELWINMILKETIISFFFCAL